MGEGRGRLHPLAPLAKPVATESGHMGGQSLHSPRGLCTRLLGTSCLGEGGAWACHPSFAPARARTV